MGLDTHHMFVGCSEELQEEFKKMTIIDMINEASELDELLESFGFRMARKYLGIYASTDLASDPKTKVHATKLYKDLETLYPIEEFSEKWI